MKKILAFTLVIMLMVSMLVLPSHAAFGKTYTALYANVNIDGEFDAAWDHAEWTTVDKPYDGADYNFPEKLRVKLLWDENFAYFLAEVIDPDLNYENDLVEVYFDEDNEKAGAYDENDHQTRFKNDGAVHELGTQPRLDSKAVGKTIDGGWIIEGAINWVLPHKEGDVLGLEFMFNIGDSTADFTQALRWNVDTAGGDTPPYTSTEFFGVLTLGAPVPPIVEEVVIELPPDALVSDIPPAVVVPVTAPQTGDTMLYAGAVLVLAGAALLMLKRKTTSR